MIDFQIDYWNVIIIKNSSWQSNLQKEHKSHSYSHKHTSSTIPNTEQIQILSQNTLFFMYIYYVFECIMQTEPPSKYSFIHNPSLIPCVHIPPVQMNSPEHHFSLTSLPEYHILQAMCYLSKEQKTHLSVCSQQTKSYCTALNREK